MRNLLFALALPCFAAVATAEDKTISVPPGRDAAVTLIVPKTAKVTTDNGKTTIDTNKVNVYLWLAPKAKTIADAVAGVGEIVKSEVKDLKIEETKTVKVADADAKDITAKSNEADDGDPGTTDIIVFTVGGKVIVACVHGEGEAAARQRQPMLDILATAKAAVRPQPRRSCRILRCTELEPHVLAGEFRPRKVLVSFILVFFPRETRFLETRTDSGGTQERAKRSQEAIRTRSRCGQDYVF